MSDKIEEKETERDRIINGLGAEDYTDALETLKVAADRVFKKNTSDEDILRQYMKEKIRRANQ